MRNNLFILLLVLIPILFSNSVIAGRCSGGAYCTACSNCSSCKNCSEEGGTCSVCANYDDTKDYDVPKEEKSSYSWLWGALGIGAILVISTGGTKK